MNWCIDGDQTFVTLGTGPAEVPVLITDLSVTLSLLIACVSAFATSSEWVEITGIKFAHDSKKADLATVSGSLSFSGQ